MFTEFNQASFNLLLQFLVILVLVAAVYQKRKNIKIHCRLTSVAVLLQLLSIIAFMFPSMSNLSDMGIGSSLQNRLYLHHFAGLLVVVFSIYIRFAVDGRIKRLVNPYKLMKATLALWLLVFIGGIVLYLSLWEGISIL